MARARVTRDCNGRADPRWNFWPTLACFLVQLVVCIVIFVLVAVSGGDYYGTFFLVDVGPLSTAAASAFSLIVYLICLFTKKLHPLVVLTLSIEFLILYLGTTILSLIVFIGNGYSGCKAEDFEDDYGYGYSYRYDYYGSSRNNDDSSYDDYLQKKWRGSCQRSTAVVAFNVIMLASYIFLVTWSAVMRNRTKMPFVKHEDRAAVEPMLQHGAAGAGTGASVGTSAASRGSAVRETPVVAAEEADPEMGEVQR